jgi:hypothetical protein
LAALARFFTVTRAMSSSVRPYLCMARTADIASMVMVPSGNARS